MSSQGREQVVPQSERPEQIFSGLRVIDVGHVLAGPMTSSLLGDFGADVVRVVPPGPEATGDTVVINRSKRCITLDMRRPEAEPIFHRLVAVSDVLTENFRPYRMEEWGHSWDTLHKINPRLIYARMSGFGLTGPYSRRRAYGMIGEAFAGWSWLNGFPDGPAMHSSFSWGDTLDSQYAAMSIVMALYWRDVLGGGEGQLIDQGLVEPLFRQIEQQIIVFDQTGHAPTRNGTTHEANPYADVCQTQDGEWFSYSAPTRATIRALLVTFDLSEKKFADIASAELHRDEFHGEVRKWFSNHTLREVEDAFLANGACGTKAMSAADLVNDPQVQARDMVVKVPNTGGGEPLTMQGVVPKFSRSPGEIQATGARPGQHNDEIYRGLLGMRSDEIESLQAAGVI